MKAVGNTPAVAEKPAVAVKAPAVAKVAAKQETVVPNQYVSLDSIVNSKELIYRKAEAAHVEALAADILANGLDQPLLTFAPQADSEVRLSGAPNSIPATYLVAGNHRRHALAKIRRDDAAAFKKRFPAGIPILHRICSVAEALLLQVRENVQRREMSAEEIFPILAKLAAAPYTMKGKDIAKKVGKSTAWVSQMMAVNEELDEDTKKDVVEGKIAVGDARKLAGELRAAGKAGKPATAAEIKAAATELKNKQAAKVASGVQRSSGDDRRVSAKKIWGRYRAMPNVGTGRRVQILEGAFEYLLSATKVLPAELRKEIKVSAVKAPAKTPAKAAAKK